MKNRVIKTAIEDFESWENGKVTEKYIKRLISENDEPES